jgi:hypothetical protein
MKQIVALVYNSGPYDLYYINVDSEKDLNLLEILILCKNNLDILPDEFMYIIDGKVEMQSHRGEDYSLEIDNLIMSDMVH